MSERASVCLCRKENIFQFISFFLLLSLKNLEIDITEKN